MKKSTSVLLLSLTACVLGILGYITEYLLYQKAVDAEGLIITGNIFTLILTGIILTAVVIVFSLSRKTATDIGNPPKWLSIVEGILVFLLAYAIYQNNSGKLNIAYFALGCISAWLCLLRVFVPQLKFSSHLLVGVYFALHVILQYRAASSDPQILDYMFPLLADIAIMLYSYHKSATEVEMGSAKGQVFWRFMAAFFGILGAYHGGYAYLLAPIWLLPNQKGEG